MSVNPFDDPPQVFPSDPADDPGDPSTLPAWPYDNDDWSQDPSATWAPALGDPTAPGGDDPLNGPSPSYIATMPHLYQPDGGATPNPPTPLPYFPPGGFDPTNPLAPSDITPTLLPYFPPGGLDLSHLMTPSDDTDMQTPYLPPGGFGGLDPAGQVYRYDCGDTGDWGPAAAPSGYGFDDSDDSSASDPLGMLMHTFVGNDDDLDMPDTESSDDPLTPALSPQEQVQHDDAGLRGAYGLPPNEDIIGGGLLPDHSEPPDYRKNFIEDKVPDWDDFVDATKDLPNAGANEAWAYPELFAAEGGNVPNSENQSTGGMTDETLEDTKKFARAHGRRIPRNHPPLAFRVGPGHDGIGGLDRPRRHHRHQQNHRRQHPLHPILPSAHIIIITCGRRLAPQHRWRLACPHPRSSRPSRRGSYAGGVCPPPK